MENRPYLDNYDGMFPEDIQEAIPKIEKHLEKMLPAKDRLAYQNLLAYCQDKLEAMRFRMSGNIEAASKHERSCDRIYKLLPVWAKW